LGEAVNRGIVYALSAYIFWGLHPIYWKQLHNVPSVEILAHRILWSFVFFLIIITGRRGWSELKRKVCQRGRRWILFVPAFLIGSNWGVYIWAVNAGYIIETSLGYFICPLISVFLGVIFLRERLRPVQWVAIGIAAAGVLVMTFLYGQFPWISIYLALSWGSYGLLRKQSPLGPVQGLTLETLLLSILSLAFLITRKFSGSFAFLQDGPTSLLLMGTGIISGLPLLIFIAGARLIDLTLIGILQYVYPTLIFVIGYFIYQEPLNQSRLIGFSFIWTALLLYSIEGFYMLKKKRP
jgi:chloramphenicol-sensitive protein RarD